MSKIVACFFNILREKPTAGYRVLGETRNILSNSDYSYEVAQRSFAIKTMRNDRKLKRARVSRAR
ncbi:MAG: hypothetical protein MJ214_05500 [Bacilli bacterium]|nr:hypothetical protein [Bacilli bacterium]